MITVDNSQVEALFKKLKKESKPIYNQAVKGYATKMAFETQKKAKKIVESKYNYKNSSILNRTKKNIRYTPAKKVSGKWESEVGAVGDIKESSGKGIGAFWLGEQELGTEVKQKKFKKTSLRSNLMTRVISGKMKSKQVKKIDGNVIETIPTRVGLVIGIKKAKREGKRYVSSKWGVYQVNSGAYIPKKKNAVKIYNFTDKKIKRKKITWLLPAIKTLEPHNNQIALNEINRAFQKFAKP